jgi:spore germination cell wall hydrolase CwlJ-like protein
LNFTTQARAKARALAGATALGSIMGLTFGGAYLAGGMAQAAVKRADITRLADSTAGNWSDEALMGAPSWDQGALAIAKRHDPYSVAGAPERDRQSTYFAESRERFASQWSTPSADDTGLKPSVDTENSSDAIPFRASQLNSLNASRELDCLTTAVYYEARGEGSAGMKAVAQVVLNRVRHPSFPKSVCGVIYQGAGKGRGCQFSFACDGSMRKRKDMALWDRARDIASRAMDGETMNTVGSSTFFHATRLQPNWRGLTRVATVGRHVFYRHSGARGSASLLAQGPLRGSGAVLNGPTLYKVANEASQAKKPQVVMASFAAEPVATITPTLISAASAFDSAKPTAAPAVDSAPTLDAIVDSAI